MLKLIKPAFRIIKTTFHLLILIALIIFMINNRTSTTVSLFPLPIAIDTPVFMVMISFFILGIIFGILISLKTSLLKKTNKLQSKKSKDN